MKKFNLFFYLAFFAGSVLFLSSCGNDDDDDALTLVDPNATVFELTTDPVGNAAIKITDKGQGVGTRTFDRDTVYILDNNVFVNDGQILTIESGTVIKGESGTGANSASLIVARGGQLIANGTATQPIIMTSIIDDLDVVTDVQPSTRGLWGGLILLGKANINDPSGESGVEGIPTTETRGLYGGTDDADNSGSLSYISIRHAGTEIGAGNEINGLTLGAVGSATTIDYIEVFANFDDGYEWFGGTVNAKHLISAYNGDDAIDWDQGFTGKVQYLLVAQEPNVGGRGCECNGVVNDAPFDYNSTPLSKPTFSHATFVGHNRNSGESNIFVFRQNSGGLVYNSIFYNFAGGIVASARGSGETVESVDRLAAGDILFANNIFGEIAGGTTLADAGASIEVDDMLALPSNNNVYNNTIGLQGPTMTKENFNPLLVAGGAADGVSVRSLDSFFTTETKIGAFPSGTNWATGWTAIDEYGFFE